MCMKPRGRAYTCPACQKAKIACLVNKVRRGGLDKPKTKRAKLEGEGKSEAGPGAGSSRETGMGEVVQLLQELLAETRRHNARTEELLGALVEDPNYVPPLEDPSEPEYEWRPVTEPEHEMVREIAADLRRKAKEPLGWSARYPHLALNTTEMGDLWWWFHKKGLVDADGDYIGSSMGSDDEAGEGKNEEGSKKREANETEVEEGEQGKEMDPEVQEVEKGAEDVDME